MKEDYPATLEDCIDVMVSLNANEQGQRYFALIQQRQQDEELIRELSRTLSQVKRGQSAGKYILPLELYDAVEAAINKATKRVGAVKREQGE